MRGFPLIGSLVALVLFAASWPILQATIGGRVEATPESSAANMEVGNDLTEDSTEAENGNELVSLRVISSAKMTRLRIDYLGEPLTDGTPGGVDFEKELVDFAFPSEGVDFWIEADFGERSGTSGDSAPVALRLEVEDADGEVYRKTLWSDGDQGIADSVYVSSHGEEGGDQ